MSGLTLLFGYLIGSLPTAYLIGRHYRGADIRRLGDGNMGAGNAYRLFGARLGIAVFVVDAVKGALAVLLARVLNLSEPFVLATGVLAVCGHNWPVFLRFRGGRGESTTLGVLFVLLPLPMLCIVPPVILGLWLLRDVTRVSAVCVPLLLVFCWLFRVPPYLMGYLVGLFLLVGLTHYLRTHPRPREA